MLKNLLRNLGCALCLLIATACSESNQAPTACFTISTTAQDIEVFKYDDAIHFTIHSNQTSLNLHFDASSSTDIDSQDLHYTWNLGDGTNYEGVVVNKVYPYTPIDEYVEIKLVVTDEQGNSQESHKRVRVVDAIRPLLAPTSFEPYDPQETFCNSAL